MVVTAHASTPYKKFNDVVQAAKSKPGTAGYGTIVSGSNGYLAMTYLGNLLKVDWTHIPYKGAAHWQSMALLASLPAMRVRSETKWSKITYPSRSINRRIVCFN